jgi:signal transduction histidine kinase
VKSIRGRLLVWVTTGTMLVVLAAGLLTSVLASRGLQEQADETLLARARSMGALVIDEAPDPEEDDEGGLVLEYKGPLSEVSLGLTLLAITLEGEVIERSPDWPLAMALPDEDLQVGDAGLRDVELPDGRAARLAWVVVQPFAEVDIPADEIDEAADGEGERGEDEILVPTDHEVAMLVVSSRVPLVRAQRAVLLAVLGGVVLAAAGAWLAARLAIGRGLEPLTSLAGALRDVQTDELQPLDEPRQQPEELSPIVGSLNDLLTRMAAAMARERRFTDAAAHELRTPLAELRAACDVATKFPDRERQARCVSDASAIADEMTALIEALLSATRGSTSADERIDVPIGSLVSELIEPHRAVLRERDVSLHMTAESDASWVASRGAVRMIVRNLVGNAVAYTPSRGRITIDVSGGPGTARLAIRNRPVHLETADVERIFEPFWRADASRSDREHRGLGLSIVAAQCAAAGLRCEASLTDADGLTLLVECGVR